MPNPYEEIEEDEEPKPKKKGRRITDLKVSEISVVDKAANGERFLLYKAADPLAGARRATASDDADARRAAAKTNPSMGKKGPPAFIQDKIDAKEEDEDMTCPECGEDMDDCTCDEIEKSSPLTAFTEKYGMGKAEDSLETDEFDEAGVLGLLQKHTK